MHPGSPPVRFFPVQVSDGTAEKAQYQLHTHPIGIVECVLGLVSSDGLGTLTQISSPYQIEYPDGTSADWSSWAMVEGSDGVDGEQGSSYLDYLGSPGGRWIAFPSGEQDSWVVTWDDGKFELLSCFVLNHLSTSLPLAGNSLAVVSALLTRCASRYRHHPPALYAYQRDLRAGRMRSIFVIPAALLQMCIWNLAGPIGPFEQKSVTNHAY